MSNEKSEAVGNVLILLAHPNMGESKANRTLVEAVKGLPSVKVVNLYEQPLDVEFYREELTAAKAVVFQFPFYWASAPSQLKKWTDEVFGAFMGSEVIRNKPLLVATTAGSEYEAYRSGGRNKYTMDELLRPYQLQANHSGMQWVNPFVVYGVVLPDGAESIAAGAEAYRKCIEALLK